MRYLFIYFFIFLFLISCTRKWSSNELNLVSSNYLNVGYSASEVECLVENMAEKISPSDYLASLENLKKGSSIDRSYIEKVMQIESKCVEPGYTDSLKKRLVFIFQSRGLNESASLCVFEEIQKRYSYEQYMKEDSNYIAGEATPSYVAFLNVVERDCKNK